MKQHARPIIIFLLTGLTLGLFLLAAKIPHFNQYPAESVLSPTASMNRFMHGFVENFGAGFKAVGWLLEWPIFFAQTILAFLPWSVTTAIFVFLAYIASGIRLALFTLFAFLYMAAIGYWNESMNTLAIVLISVPLAITIGFVVGVLGFYSKKASTVIMQMLDLLQKIPAFVYILLILILFGLGTTVGLVASVLYAFPPMVRNTILGLKSVPDAIIEAGLVSGATGSQLFWKIRLPAAKSQLLLGVNQTTMAAFNMVIIAAIIGGTNDIGWEILSTMQMAQFGESLLAGIVVALTAIALDRITYGFATREKFEKPTIIGFNAWFVAIYTIAILATLSLFFPLLNDWPEGFVFNLALPLNSTLETLLVNGREWIETIKNVAIFYVLLPIKIGLSNAASPLTWGVGFSPLVLGIYCSIVLAVVVLAVRAGSYTLAALICLLGVASYIGLTNIPWVGLVCLTVYAAYLASGFKLAIGAALGLAFLIIAGVWPQTVSSIYLCGIAVIISFLLGTLIGIFASESYRFSRLIKPVLDTLKTMPLFVILIPFVMLFKIGEFTALLAIIAYAIVPAIRYTEHGLRNLPADKIEAARAIGCTEWQLLTRVKLPLAMPAIMLGLNQTIVYGITMLVIAALVGTNGLGKQIYIGLSKGDFGVVMTAGIGIVIIAMIADRMTMAISRRKQEEYGFQTAWL